MKTPSDIFSKEDLTKFISLMKVSLDPMAIIDKNCKIIQMNIGMRSFLKLRSKRAGLNETFCSYIKLKDCEKSCKVEEVIKDNIEFKVTEGYAQFSGENLRLNVRVIPLSNGSGNTLGALLTVRNTTAEILVQKKYHKVLSLMEQKDTKINDLEEVVLKLRNALRSLRAINTSSS